MVIRLLGSADTEAYRQAADLVLRLGHKIDDGSYFCIDLAIAPLLTRFLGESELSEPLIGTLVFHPSPLPYGRGASSLRWAYRRKESITGVTWFWANNGKADSGDICEQEVLKINYSLSPREYYRVEIIPALLRTLERALNEIDSGVIRKIPQNNAHASFDFKIV